MAWRSGSLSRTLMSTVRSSSSRLSSSASQLRPPPPLTSPRRLTSRYFSSTSRYLNFNGIKHSDVQQYVGAGDSGRVDTSGAYALEIG